MPSAIQRDSGQLCNRPSNPIPATLRRNISLDTLKRASGDAAGAEQQFRLAVKAAPNYVQAWVALAATLAMESRFPEAQDAVETALKMEPAIRPLSN
jgi:Tfp pilus assembly protein PilF